MIRTLSQHPLPHIVANFFSPVVKIIKICPPTNFQKHNMELTVVNMLYYTLHPQD